MGGEEGETGCRDGHSRRHPRKPGKFRQILLQQPRRIINKNTERKCFCAKYDRPCSCFPSPWPILEQFFIVQRTKAGAFASLTCACAIVPIGYRDGNFHANFENYYINQSRCSACFSPPSAIHTSRSDRGKSHLFPTSSIAMPASFLDASLSRCSGLLKYRRSS